MSLESIYIRTLLGRYTYISSSASTKGYPRRFLKGGNRNQKQQKGQSQEISRSP